MTMNDDVERSLTGWLFDAATPREVALDDVFARTRTTRQRPAWSSPGRWLPMQLTMPRVAIPRALPILAVIALSIAALVVAGLLVGSQRPPLPPPFGLAATGETVFDARGDLFVANPDGTGLRAFLAGPGDQFGAVYSRDGTRIAYWSAAQDASKASLWIIDADGRNARNVSGDLLLTADRVWPAVDWAPDSRSFVFAAGGELFAGDVSGSAPRRIGASGVQRSTPVWSPVGDLIAYLGTDSAGIHGLYVMAPDGTRDQLVVELPADEIHSPPVWSLDGSQMAYQAVDDIRIAVRGAADWTERVVVGGPTVNSWPAWSSDGKRLSYLRSDTENHGHIYIGDELGAGAVELRSGLIGWGPHCWSPDDKTIRAIIAEPNEALDLIELPRYEFIAVDGNGTAAVPAKGMQAFGACSWQRPSIAQIASSRMHIDARRFPRSSYASGVRNHPSLLRPTRARS